MATDSPRPFQAFTKWHALASLAAILLAALILNSLGRARWCSCGQLSLWSSEIQSLHNSQHLFDPYTLTHVLHGVGFYAVLWLLLRKWAGPAFRGVLAVALESSWEVLENTSLVIDKYRSVTVSYGYYGDSIANSVGDVLACIVGYVLTMLVPGWMSAAGFLIIEGILLWWIRDGLLLNLLMLLWPIESIRNWQLEGTLPAAAWVVGIPRDLLKTGRRLLVWPRSAPPGVSQCDRDD